MFVTHRNVVISWSYPKLKEGEILPLGSPTLQITTPNDHTYRMVGLDASSPLLAEAEVMVTQAGHVPPTEDKKGNSGIELIFLMPGVFTVSFGKNIDNAVQEFFSQIDTQITVTEPTHVIRYEAVFDF